MASNKRLLTESEWEEARHYWETTPGSNASKARYLSAKYGAHQNTFTMKARQHGWFSPDEEHLEAVEAVREAAPTAAPDWMNIEDKLAYENRIAELEHELAQSRATADRLRPDVDIRHRLFNTADDVLAFYGQEGLAEIAMVEIADVNRQRQRRGFPGLSAAEMQPDATRITQEANKLITQRRSEVPAQGHMNRAVKMVNPKKFCDHPSHGPNDDVSLCYYHGTLVPIPLESTTNNLNGSQHDATARYNGPEKRFKLTSPLLCFAAPCWEPAEVDVRGKLVYGGYCCADHRNRTEPSGGDNSKVSLGAITSQSLAVG